MADFGSRGRAAGCLSISVDADLMGHGASGAKGRTAAAESVLRDLIDQFQRHRLAASWAFSEPAAAGLTRTLGAVAGQEIALAASADVSPIDGSRGAFVHGWSIRCGGRHRAERPFRRWYSQAVGSRGIWMC